MADTGTGFRTCATHYTGSASGRPARAPHAQRPAQRQPEPRGLRRARRRRLAEVLPGRASGPDTSERSEDGPLPLLAADAAILAISLGLLEPPELTTMAETALDQLEARPDAAVIAAAAVIAILGATFSIRHLLPAHQQRGINELKLPSAQARDGTAPRSGDGPSRRRSRPISTDSRPCVTPARASCPPIPRRSTPR
jgi:hypothetical protein